MQPISNIELAVAALAVEAAFGYPAVVYRAIGHPVTWMGALISALERRCNRAGDPDGGRRLAGSVTLVLLLAVSMAAAFAFTWVVPSSALGVALCVVVASSLLAQRSLHEHVGAVADALAKDGLAAGRKKVSMIVGRNPERLDEAGVARAAIESLAENFSDGIVAPTFWLVVAGLPGAAAYKMLNTADSMIGHRTPRYRAFGWAAARLDDLLNLPASRLSAVLIAAAAPLVGGSAANAWRAVMRDASKHRSPNAGWPEAAMAGALGIAIAGPRVYGETAVDDAFMGDGRREVTAADIERALRLYRIACALQWLVLLVLAVIWRW
jgi:adenosylcobinamide-phosphate synthase